MSPRSLLFLVLSTAVAAAGCESSEPVRERAVPEVVPMYVQDGVERLEQAGFAVSISSVPTIERADLATNGYAVATQDPKGGSRAPEGSTVRLTVMPSVNGGRGGLGKDGRVSVPTLIGLDINRALGVAGAGGLLVTVAPLDHEVERLVVTGQSEPPGSIVDAGMEIVLRVG
jgi:beta-lactam-binding protein with PASTA domain